MREIKLRAWENDKKRWLLQQKNVTLPIGLMTEYATGKDWTLMQYTGLKDKDGKEIYEGDIVRRGKHIGVVTYVAPEYAMKCSSYEPLRAIGVCEVIGNIHDNPDLLERSSDDTQ